MRRFLATLLLAFSLSTCGTTAPVLARDDGRYANSPYRDWYRNAELTEAAQKRFLFKSCCDHSDVFRTRFRVNKLTGDDEWYYLVENNQWKRIPPDIIHWGKSAPDGQPTLFMLNGAETCFFPGEGGI